MRSLDHKQIFLDTLRLYFAPLTGAVRGCIREIDMVSRQIERRRRVEWARSERESCRANQRKESSDLSDTKNR